MSKMTDVQVYDYVLDNGTKVVFSFAVHGQPTEDRPISTTITVNDVIRLQSDHHWILNANAEIDEKLIAKVCGCLSKHMIEWNTYANLTDLVGADYSDRLPVDSRHIAELSDEQAEWWSDRETESKAGRLVLLVCFALAQRLGLTPPNIGNMF